jgi:hypothetical protein
MRQIPGLTLLEKPDGQLEYVANELVDDLVDPTKNRAPYRAPGTSTKQIEQDVVRNAVKEPIGQLEAGARGALQGVSMGYGDELTGLVSGDLAKDYDRARNQAAKDQYPKTTMGADIGGSLAGTFIPGGLAARTAGSAGRRIGGVAAQGAVEGLGRSDDKTTGDAAMGAGAGLVGYGAAKGLEGILGVLRPSKLTEFANTQAVRATDARVPELRKAGMNVNELGQNFRDKGLVKAFDTPSKVLQRSEDLQGSAGRMIGKISDEFTEKKLPITKSRLEKQLKTLLSDDKNIGKLNPKAREEYFKKKEIIDQMVANLRNTPKVTMK